MATAIPLKKTVSDGVTLTLSQAEAEALRLVLAYVGGPEFDTPRKHTEAVLRTLKNANIDRPAVSYQVEGVIRFAAPGTPKSNPFVFHGQVDPYTLTNTTNTARY